MKFTELTTSTTTEAQELVADIMWNYTNYGVAISDVKDVVELLNDRKSTWDYVDDEVLKELNRGVTLVKAYIPLDITDETVKKIEKDLETLKENCKGNIETGSLETVKRIVDGDDWIEIWRKHYRPIELGNVLICPAWIKREPKEGQIEVIIDSNMAFGTGEHETTSMCVEEMQNYLRAGDTCIDVGCGSGILGISAVKLGAAKAYLTDVDEIAVKSANHNAALNGVADKCVVAHADLLEDTTVQGDVVLANITGEILVRLAPSIPKNLKKGGVLILSGIIESRLEMVKKAFSAEGLRVVKQRQKGDWYALVLRFNEAENGERTGA